MDRKEPLRADPDKTRAWQQRSAAKAAENARSKPRAQLARSSVQSKPVADRPREDPRTVRSRRRQKAIEGNPLGKDAVPFKARRPARMQACFRCGRRPAQAWHHWIGQEHLRVMARGLLRGLPVELVQSKLRDWLRDERNLSAVCKHCHDQGESATVKAAPERGTRQGRFVRDEVRAAAPMVGVFATELDDELEAAERPREAVVRLMREWRDG